MKEQSIHIDYYQNNVNNLETSDQKHTTPNPSSSCSSVTTQNSSIYKEQKAEKEEEKGDYNDDDDDDDEELRKLLLPNIEDLPLTPPSSIVSNFVTYYAPDFIKPGHDQYVHRHANGLCVIGLAPTHMAFNDKGGITAVDFNVGKSDRSNLKVTGKRKRNAQHFESNTALCKVCTSDASYIVRCCVKGSLLEVNERLIKQPELLHSAPEREGYIAIIMPKPADWLKLKSSFSSAEEYRKLKSTSILSERESREEEKEDLQKDTSC